ncbi:ATP-binding cassette sub-family C member 4 [Temnothorax longispinosus]|uniref:ATP-binding cassette sub-family C member 4 n=1 Tax=Temnothorax longispinosus TaxID=300112 RepID=UPI003A9A5150
MDSTKVRSKPNPREKANIVSLLLWWWTISLFKTGYKKALDPDDLFDPLKVDRSKLLGDRLEKRWNIELENSKKWKRSPSLLKTIFRTFLWEYSMLGIIQILNEFVIRLGTPLLLGGLLRYFRKDSVELYESALWYAAGICIATGINVISGNQAIFGAFHVGAKVRVAVCSVVYRKALRLSKSALGETAPGKVVNLVANDVNRFDLVSIFIHYMWTAPLSALIVAYILYQEVSYAGLIGIAAVFVVVPIQSYTGKLSSKFRLQTAIKTDERVRLMDEIISGVQVIKMYAWEKPFCAMVELARKLELRVVTKSSYIRGIYMTFNLFTTRMALYCTLVSMLMFGNDLTADKVFVVSSYFNILAHTMAGMFVRGFAELAECMVAIRRLQGFLMFEEFRGSNVVISKASSGYVNMNSDFKRNFSKPDLPYIDDDVVENQLEPRGGQLDENSDRRKQNGLMIVASDLLKNTANFVGEKKESSVIYDTNNWAINMINVTAKWEEKQSENTLENLNLEIEKGKLYAVIGMVGNGKSSFLSAILGEISLTEGQVKVNGGVSYASQEAWVFGATVRQNILFGQAYERQRYQKVVKACALARDFKQFPQGDQTVVGERGSSLSGGQKARINLARALYRQSDIYLLDDPLSAVDAHVSKHLFHECIQRYLAGKTRILATHQLQYIKGVDAIILLEQGRMKYFSHYQDLLEYRPEYGVLLAAENEAIDDSSLEKSINIRRQFSSSSNRSRTPEASSGGTDDEDEDQDPEKLNDGLEGTSRGMVKGPIFIKFFQTGANLYMAFTVLLLFIITQFIVSLNDYFVPILINFVEAQNYEAKHFNLNQTDDVYTNTTNTYEHIDIEDASVINYVYIYTGIILAIFFVGITRSLVFYKTCMTCSQRLHDMMFSALIRTGMRFFDTNPSGRILNRFSKDMGAIDELLPKAILDAGQMNMNMFGALIVTCVVNPIFLVPIVIISVIFYWIRKVYLKTSKNIKRLDGMLRSPVFTHLNATLNGLTTIRAYCAQDILKHEFDKLQDTHTSTTYMYIVTSTAFGFFLDVFCFVFTSLVTFSFLVLNQSFSGGEVGLAITQVMAMTGLIQWGMRQSAEVANQMMAVERVLEYIQLPAEPNLRDRGAYVKKKDKNLALPSNAPKTWPDKGCITFRNVYMRYADDDLPVLKGLNIVIYPGEKIGIVGRTGAGKSSLISALFRLAKVDGIIEIDGADTGLMALEDLRRNISIIPQDPVLFSGTLRRNLDPFDEFPDKDLWEALEEVELKEAVIIGNGLESRVFDRGSNYSVGQRQLVCLARAILRNNRILMLDEATANVDPQTDALIQRTIRKKFVTCTMLTVAHRLNTIMDSDKVLVMDKGRMAEYDHPHILLKNSYSQFTSLVKETGPGMHDQLAKVAKQAYVNKYGET